MKVVLNDPWWHNKTYYKKGAVVEVPAGTSVPSGSIVDGKLIPRKHRGGISKTEAIANELKAAQARIAELEAGSVKTGK